MGEVLDQLFPFMWREVEVPISKMRMSIAHDLVPHKYWGVDGARVESTGLEPIRITATIPLQTGIVPGYRETWDPAKVYPTLMRALILSFSKREKGLLQHPEFGGMVCKADKLDIDWDAMKRGGCDAEASWIETADDDAEALRFDKSPVAEITDAAKDFDAVDSRLKDLVDRELAAKGLPARYPVFNESFESLVNKAVGVVDKVTFAATAPQRYMDRIKYRASLVEHSVNRARTALGWPVRHRAASVTFSANTMRRQLVESNREIGLFRVPKTTTLANISLQIASSSVGELVRLNPHLMSNIGVPVGSVVRFYGPRLYP